MGRTGIMALPADVLRCIYKKGIEQGKLDLKDRVRALGVCRAWREALSTAALPIALLEFGGNDLSVELCKWVIVTQPTVEAVSIRYPNAAMLELLQLTLHSLPRKAVRTLYWSHAIAAHHVLCFLETWSSLQSLTLEGVPCVMPWLQQLSSLRQLGTLTLDLFMGAAGQRGQTLLLPPMPSLTSLAVGFPQGVHLHLQLARLPLLRELKTHEGDGVVLEASSGAPASQLRAASLESTRVAVDFAQLPALVSLVLAPGQLEGAATIAAATSLTYLQLGDGYAALECEWVEEVLRRLPRSLRALAVCGEWTAESAALVGNMSHLSGLYITTIDPAFPLPPSGAPLWGQLRALSLVAEGSPLPLPEALGTATRLEALQVYVKQPSALDLRLLSSLPALSKLVLVCIDEEGRRVGERMEEAVLWLADSGMPNLQVLADRKAVLHNADKFFDWALGS